MSAVGLASLGVVPVAATEPDAVEVASRVVPDVVADATVDEHALDVAVRTGDVAVTVPSDADEGIDLFLPGADDFTIGLPFAEDATVTGTDAGVAFDNGNGSSTVPLVKDDGVVQLLTTIEDADAPTEYAYPLDLPEGAALALTADGGAEVINADGAVIATIDAPWAIDANGIAVATHYQVAGDTLTQVIDLSSATAFPVVADPKVTRGIISGTTYWNKAETTAMSKASAPSIVGACTAAGAAMGSVVIAGVLAAKCAVETVRMQYYANLAIETKRCLSMKIYYGTTLLVFGTYSGGYCK